MDREQLFDKLSEQIATDRRISLSLRLLSNTITDRTPSMQAKLKQYKTRAESTPQVKEVIKC